MDSTGRLVTAAANRDLRTVQQLLASKNVDVNGSDERRSTALHFACASGHVEIVTFLLASTADPNVHDHTRSTPLHHAAREGHVQITDILLKAGADPNARDNSGSTALHLAALRGNHTVVKGLLSAWAHTNVKNKRGYAPIHLCVESFTLTYRFIITVQTLMTAGARWDTQCDEIVGSHELPQAVAPLRVCMLQWEKDLVQGLPMVGVPVECLQRGVYATQVYIDQYSSLCRRVARRPIC